MKKLVSSLCAMGFMLGTLAGCSTPKVVTSITGRGEQTKFVFIQGNMFGTEQGIVECTSAANGDLSNCERKPIIFKK